MSKEVVEIKVEGACCNQPYLEPEYCTDFTSAMGSVFEGSIEELRKNIDEIIREAEETVSTINATETDEDGREYYCWVSWIEIVVYNNNNRFNEKYYIRIYTDGKDNWKEKLRQCLYAILLQCENKERTERTR